MGKKFTIFVKIPISHNHNPLPGGEAESGDVELGVSLPPGLCPPLCAGLLLPRPPLHQHGAPGRGHGLNIRHRLPLDRAESDGHQQGNDTLNCNVHTVSRKQEGLSLTGRDTL